MPKFLLRLISFPSKEIWEVLRQPRLVLTLILGPFLILLLFGVGYTGARPQVRVLLVVPEGAAIRDQIQPIAGQYGGPIKVVEITSDAAAGQEKLINKEVDVLAQFPDDAYAEFRSGHPITLTVLVNEIDPVGADYAAYLVNALVTRINQDLVVQGLARARTLSAGLDEFSQDTLVRLDELDQALGNGDTATALQRLDELEAQVDAASVGLDTALGLSGGIYAAVGRAVGGSDEEVQKLQASREALTDMKATIREVRGQIVQADGGDVAKSRAQLQETRGLLDQLQEVGTLLRDIPPEVLVNPFTLDIHNINSDRLQGRPPGYIDFYAPAVLALLVQHLAVTFGALSLVREKLLGADEIFRVAPIAPVEILAGKYLSYIILGLVLGGILTALILVLGVPFFGSVWAFLLTLLLVTVASLGWGFFISLISQSESQAVQLSMISLLAAVFFSGFFLPISGLRLPVQYLAYALPVYYGREAFQRLFLVGAWPNPQHLLALLGLAVFFFVLNSVLFARDYRKQ